MLLYSFLDSNIMGKKKRRPSGATREPGRGPTPTPVATPAPHDPAGSPASPDGGIVLADERMNPAILAWSPDSKYLVTRGRQCVLFWDAMRGASIFH